MNGLIVLYFQKILTIKYQSLSHFTIKEFGGHRCYQKSPYANEKASARCFCVAFEDLTAGA